MRRRPVSSKAALVPFNVALRAGKKAYCSAIEFTTVKRRASYFCGLPSAVQLQTSLAKTEEGLPWPRTAGNWSPHRDKEDYALPPPPKSRGYQATSPQTTPSPPP